MLNKRMGFTFSIFIVMLSISLSSAQLNNKGANYETNCQNNICTTQVYSYEKYFFRDNQWEEINENFFDCSSEGRTKYCTKDYHFNVLADDGDVSAKIGNNEFAVKLNNFRNLPLQFSPVIEGNTLIYKDVVQDYVDVKYSYFPTKLKEEIIIKQRLLNLENDLEIQFTKRGNAPFSVDPSYVCDSEGICAYLSHRINENNIIITVPRWILEHEDLTYPLYVDPTITLDNNSILWNGYITNETNSSGSFFVRHNNPNSNIKVGNLLSLAGPNGTTTIYGRGNIDWNVSSIPDGADIYSIKLGIYTETSSNASINISVNVTQMEGNSFTYSDTEGFCQGNCHFYTDINNGSFYNSSILQTERAVNLTLSSQAIIDLKAALPSDKYSTGLLGYWNLSKEVWIKSRDANQENKRPRLIVTYSQTLTAFNNSLSLEDLIFTDNQNITRYLDIIKTANVISGFMNLSGLASLIDPIQVGVFSNSTSTNNPKSIFVINDLTYIVSNGSSDSLVILNTSNKSNPQQIGFFSDNINMQGPTEVFISNDVAYISSSSSDSLMLINISNPSNLINISVFINGSSIDSATGVKVIGDFAYVLGRGSNSLAIINVSNKNTPYQIGAITGFDRPISLFVLNDLVYIASDTPRPGSLNIINASNKSNPVLLSSLENASSMDLPQDVFVVDDIAYLTSLGFLFGGTISHLNIINVSNPSNPIEIGTFSNESSISGAQAIYILDNISYITARSNNSLTVINVTNKTNPVQLKMYYNSSSLSFLHLGLFVENNFAYIASQGLDSTVIIKVLSLLTNSYLEIGTPDNSYVVYEN